MRPMVTANALGLQRRHGCQKLVVRARKAQSQPQAMARPAIGSRVMRPRKSACTAQQRLGAGGGDSTQPEGVPMRSDTLKQTRSTAAPPCRFEFHGTLAAPG